MELTPLERAALDLLVAREEPGYPELRQQVEGSIVAERKLTGVGFYTQLVPAPGSPQAPASVGNPLGDGHEFSDGVYAEIEGLDGGAGFVLWLKDGLIETLEGFSYLSGWPDPVRAFEVRMTPINR